jgi:thiol:disulfide interchange protein DsbC
MKSIKFLVTAMLGLVCLSSFAETAEEKDVRKLLEAHMGEKSKLVSVIKTPYSGLFEIRTDGNDIFYTDRQAKYLIAGRVIDTGTLEDYTKMRIDEITKVKFNDLPLDSAVKFVKGNGKRVVAIFEDPNCGYCKHLRHTLQQMDNITVYTFMYNILAPDSADKSKNVWCSADRAKAWDEWMLNGTMPPAAPASCVSNPNDKIFALGQKLKISATPTLIFADGSRYPGAMDQQTLESKLNAATVTK